MKSKNLCISLARADKGEEVIKILKQAGYWDDPDAWRYYGDNENNFAIIGNQQNKPDAALVEKIINSVDAVLMHECLRRGINPESEDAPLSVKDALDKFFDVYNGKLSNLTALKRSEIARNILLVATGTKSNPSYAIIDKGEGQTPKKMPETFLSLTRSNKLRIPFVQGKFNMGATGTLQFCSKPNLHLIISKRNPQIAGFENDETADLWGFTIIRREDPEKGMKSSAFKYLAPNGKILMFKAESLPLLPGKYPNAYVNPLEWGSFVKLYEYQLVGLKTLVVFDLYNRLSLLLPNIALPIRMHEMRKGYTGHTLEATLSGLSVRLDEDKRENLEPKFPSSGSIKIMGQEMNLLIYAFIKGKRKKYSRNDGIIFIVSGQAHGFLPDTFFARKSVGLSYLDDSILVLADCTEFDVEVREDLFMNSRDRLRNGGIRSDIEKELKELLKKHKGLRELNQRRRREEIKGKIEEDKPLFKIIEKIIKRSPTLSKLFVEGVKLTNPFDLRDVKEQEVFKGKKNPTFFILKKDFPKENPKHSPINKRFRVQFETDAENEYFSRESDPGKFYIWANGESIDDRSINLWDGIANLTAKLPAESNVDDTIHFECEVKDIAHVESLYNEFYVKVEKTQRGTEGQKGERKKPPSEKIGNDRERTPHLDIPKIHEVRNKYWKDHAFDKESALSVKYGGEEEGYDFWVNMDNIHLETEIKERVKVDAKLLEAQYKYGMALIGIAILKEFENNGTQHAEEENVDEEISRVTRAISPFLLPMISSLGELEI